jgi:hypothetical protein
MEKLITVAEKSEKAKAAKKAPAKKKPAQPTATDQVLNIIKRSKKGVNVANWINKTGFNQKKVTNILQRTYKQGKVKRVAKGVYVRDNCLKIYLPNNEMPFKNCDITKSDS